MWAAGPGGGGWTIFSGAGRGVQQTCSLLELVGEWPGASVNFAGQLLGVASGTNWLKNHFRRLEEDGFLERIPIGSEYCYQLTRRGLLQMAARDRVYWKAVGMSSFIDDWKLTAHELGVMKVVGGFGAAGMPVVCGWRSWEQISGRTGIRPDALVWLERSPYGPGWRYFEYERRARGRVRVERKLSG